MTKRTLCRFVRLTAMAIVPSIALAQENPQQQKPTVGPPIQRIATASALSKDTIGTITSVRELPDGRVLLNDGQRRRLVLMDTTLKTVQVVLDSLSEISNAYGTRPGALIPFRGDTTLFVDPASFAMVMIDEHGKIGRVRSVWRVQDVNYVSGLGNFGMPGVDAKGRIVYRIPAQPAPPKVAPPPGVPYFPQPPDSAFVVGVHLDTRKLDTLGVVRIPKQEMRFRQTLEGYLTLDVINNPMPSTDDWAVLPDGTIAFVRGRDYRIDYLKPDGTTTSSQKLPYEWLRMLDEDKERFIDSTKNVLRKNSINNFTSNMIRWVNMYGKGYPTNFTIPEGFVPPPGLPKDWIYPKGFKFPENYIYACAPGVDPFAPVTTAATEVKAATPVAGGRDGAVTVTVPPPTTVVRGEGAPVLPPGMNLPPGMTMPGGARPSCFPAPVVFGGGQSPPAPTIYPVSVIEPSQLPDYRPPFLPGSARADMEGNLWIRTVQPRPVPGGVIYDIVSPEGELVNRLQLPPGYTLVGFGKGKVVYLSTRDATGIHLARVRLK
jgi:hypothetical protein